MSCWPHFLMDVWRSSDPKTYYLFIQKSMKIYLKINQPLDAILDRYLVDFGQIFEAKLDPSWIKIQRKNELKIHWFFDHCFDRNFIHLGRIFGPTWRQIGFLNFLGDVFRGVLMPLGAKMASRTPRECPKEQFWTNVHRFFFDFWSMFGWFFCWWFELVVSLNFGWFLVKLSLMFHWFSWTFCWFFGLLDCQVAGLLLASCYHVPKQWRGCACALDKSWKFEGRGDGSEE